LALICFFLWINPPLSISRLITLGVLAPFFRDIYFSDLVTLISVGLILAVLALSGNANELPIG